MNWTFLWTELANVHVVLLLLENSADDRFGQVVRCQTVIERYVSCYEKIQKIVEEMTFYEIN
jgi:hypothetical protein